MRSNDLHQLIISPSAHLRLLKNGEVKHFVRKSVISIPELLKAGVKRPVYFITRDVYSGAIYAELRITRDLSELADFLYNAWNEKEVNNLQPFGQPKSLIISQTIADLIPKVFKNLSYFHIKVLYPRDGFSSGVRAIRTLENNIKFYIYKKSATLDLINKAVDVSTFSSNSCPRGKEKGRFQVWYEGTAEMKIFVPGNDRDKFVRFLNG
jgi:hypothetical protein